MVALMTSSIEELIAKRREILEEAERRRLASEIKVVDRPPPPIDVDDVRRFLVDETVPTPGVMLPLRSVLQRLRDFAARIGRMPVAQRAACALLTEALADRNAVVRMKATRILVVRALTWKRSRGFSHGI